MCCTSAILPVMFDAGSERALRVAGGKTESSATAPTVRAAACRNLRRCRFVMSVSLRAAPLSTGRGLRSVAHRGDSDSSLMQCSSTR